MSVKDFYSDILGSAGLSFPVLWRVIRSAKLSRSIPLIFNFVVPGRIINALYRQIHKNKFIPKSMVIEPSYRCNMSCADCYAPEETTLMSGELLDSIITQAKKLGVFRFDLMGGEPTLPEVIDMALPVINKNKNCVFNICTNCTLIDQAFIDKVKGSKNIFYLLSMEGNKETTEARRGKGSYDAYLRSVQLLRQNKMAFSLSMTLDPNSWKEQISEQVIGDYVEISRSTEAQSAISTIRKTYDIYMQTNGSTDGFSLEQAQKEASLGESTRKNWKFEVVGNPPNKYIATSTQDFAGGEGKQVWYDVNEAKFHGYGVDTWTNPESGGMETD